LALPGGAMANRTDTQADTVHGTNPQYLVDRIIRNKIYNDAYWKEFCFGLTTESFIDRAIEIDYVGGTYGGRRRPAKFLCLFLKMLQIQPDDDVVLEYIKQADFKYLRALGAAYLRISQRPMTVYKTLEPLLADYRKLRYRDMQGKLSIIHMDEFVDWLLREETVCDVTMPQLPKRDVLEETVQLEPRISVLEDDLADLEDLEESAAGKEMDGKEVAERSNSVQRNSRSPARRRSRSRSVRSRHHSRSCSRRRRGRSYDRSVSRRPQRSCSAESRHEKKKKKRDRAEKKEKRNRREAEVDKYKSVPEKPSQKRNKDGMSVDEWNKVRKELGLKPLKN